MPTIGEIKHAKELGYKGRSIKYIWTICPDCEKPRWVQFVCGKPRHLRCLHCSITSINKHKSKTQRGEKHPAWKGGRIDSRGYIKILLQPGDFFYSMTDHNGYVLEHRLLIAKHLGRCLHHWEIVHHKNHIRGDNNIENLQLVTDERHKQITVLENKIKGLQTKVEEQNKFIESQVKEIKDLKGRFTLLEAKLMLLKNVEERVKCGR